MSGMLKAFSQGDIDRISKEIMGEAADIPPPSPPNPTSEPPCPPEFRHRIEVDIAARVNHGLRVRWAPEAGNFFIDERLPNGRWITCFAIYDLEKPMTVDGKFPFVIPDERHVKEFCESSLEIRYNTGDPKKDAILHAQAAEAREQLAKDAERTRRIDGYNRIFTGDDPARFMRAARHIENYGHGHGFREFFPVGKKEGA